MSDVPAGEVAAQQGDEARLSITAQGPDWTKTAVTVDGKLLPTKSLKLEIDPATNMVQVTVVVEHFDVDLSDFVVTERVFTAPFAAAT